MKKIISFIIITVLVLSGCGKETMTTGDLYDRLPINSGDDSNTSQMVDDAFYLNGQLKEIGENRVLIDTLEAGLVWVTLEDGLNMDVTINSVVKVQFSGAIAESYPGQASGHSLQVIDPFLTDPIHTVEEIRTRLGDDMVHPVVVWNNVMDTVAYAVLAETEVSDAAQASTYWVYVLSVYEENPIAIASVTDQVPDLNWFYDRLQVQTSSGSMEYGPEFQAIEGPVVLDDGHTPVEVVYNLTNQVYENEESNVSIEYFQVEGMVGELVQDYVNQSLKRIVAIYGEGYTDTVITAKILRQDDFLTIAYEGYNEAMSYEIQKFITLDMLTSTEITLDAIIADMASFKVMFNEASGYDYESLEGVSVYMDEADFIFNFVATDDSAVREYVRFEPRTLAPVLNMDFEMPAS